METEFKCTKCSKLSLRDAQAHVAANQSHRLHSKDATAYVTHTVFDLEYDKYIYILKYTAATIHLLPPADVKLIWGALQR